jgi:hypothetical protein
MAGSDISLLDETSKCSCKGYNLDKLLQPSILIILAQQNMHGYMIIQELERRNVFEEEKAQRFYQMEGSPRNGTGAGDIPRIGRYFRLYQNNMHLRSCLLPFELSQRSYCCPPREDSGKRHGKHQVP